MKAFLLHFILLCCFHQSLQDTPRIAACSNITLEEKKNVKSITVTLTSSGQFQVPEKYDIFNEDICDPSQKSDFCHHFYGETLMSVDINETIEFPVKRILLKYGITSNRTATITMHKFECRAPIVAQEPEVPAGSWSDKVKSVTGTCWPKGKFIAHAEQTCGKETTRHSFGGECGEGTDTYHEMTYVCDSPSKNDSFEDVLHSVRIEMTQSVAVSMAVPILEAVATISAALKRTNANSSTYHTAMDTLFKNLETFDHRPDRSPLLCKLQEEAIASSQAGIISRRGHQAHISQYFTEVDTRSRFEALCSLATHLVKGSPPEDNNKYIETLKTYNMEGFTFWFPEMKVEMGKWYVPLLKRNTPGIDASHLDFLAEPNAHLKLLEMYKEIFTPGHVDRKYLSKANVA